jgi:hypothetical protein
VTAAIWFGSAVLVLVAGIAIDRHERRHHLIRRAERKALMKELEDHR